jgi:hypothetical protein
MTLTFADADEIIERMTSVLQHGPWPNQAEIAAWKSHKRRVLYRICWSKYRRYIPGALLRMMQKSVGTTTEAGNRAKQKVIQSDPVFTKYTPVQIDAALKIGIAQMYLILAKGKASEKQFAEYVNASNPGLLSLQGWFETIDPKTMKMYPELGCLETAESFANYCRTVGPNASDYWRKVYERIGLEFTADCPQGNRLP